MSSTQPLRIGFVPEHFSVPLHLAARKHALAATLVPFPSGTGHMVTALRAHEIDVAVGLTEGWIAGLGKAQGGDDDGGYRLVGTYVTSPLRWSINVSASTHNLTSIPSLHSSRVGVSRLGSGSHIMATVLAKAHSFPDDPPFSSVVVLNDFANLRAATTADSAHPHPTPCDFFLWERTTTRAHDARLAASEGENGTSKLTAVGVLDTPWPSWMAVARTALVPSGQDADMRVKEFLEKLDQGVESFQNDIEGAVSMCVEELGYREQDVREWLDMVRFKEGVKGVDVNVVTKCVETLREAGVLVEGEGIKPEDMVAQV